MDGPPNGYDGIRHLVDDIHAHGKVSFSWITAWTRGDEDPVRRAWESSEAPEKMIIFLAVFRDRGPINLTMQWLTGLLWLENDSGVKLEFKNDERLAHQLRTLIQEKDAEMAKLFDLNREFPTIDEVVAYRRR